MKYSKVFQYVVFGRKLKKMNELIYFMQSYNDVKLLLKQQILGLISKI